MDKIYVVIKSYYEEFETVCYFTDEDTAHRCALSLGEQDKIYFYTVEEVNLCNDKFENVKLYFEHIINVKLEKLEHNEYFTYKYILSYDKIMGISNKLEADTIHYCLSNDSINLCINIASKDKAIVWAKANALFKRYFKFVEENDLKINSHFATMKFNDLLKKEHERKMKDE